MRARERQGAAALRAVGAEPRAEYRAHQLTVGDRTVPLAAPWLTIDHESAEALDDRVYRGLVDALGVRLRYSNRVLHAAGEPHDLVARIVFDVLEQVRCEAQVPDALDGVRDNIEHAFRAWCARQNITDSALGLLLYTVLHMARSRMVHPLQNELIEDTIESTRANVSPVIGTGLRHLKPTSTVSTNGHSTRSAATTSSLESTTSNRPAPRSTPKRGDESCANISTKRSPPRP